jgi:hypothetical protein
MMFPRMRRPANVACSPKTAACSLAGWQNQTPWARTRLEADVEDGAIGIHSGYGVYTAVRHDPFRDRDALAYGS